MGDDVRKVLIEQLQAEEGAPYYAHVAPVEFRHILLRPVA